jgi:hypothetical protein
LKLMGQTMDKNEVINWLSQRSPKMFRFLQTGCGKVRGQQWSLHVRRYSN